MDHHSLCILAGNESETNNKKWYYKHPAGWTIAVDRFCSRCKSSDDKGFDERRIFKPDIETKAGKPLNADVKFSEWLQER